MTNLGRNQVRMNVKGYIGRKQKDIFTSTKTKQDLKGCFVLPMQAILCLKEGNTIATYNQ